MRSYAARCNFLQDRQNPQAARPWRFKSTSGHQQNQKLTGPSFSSRLRKGSAGVGSGAGFFLFASLPAAEEQASFEAEVDSAHMIIPLGPALYFGSAAWTARATAAEEKTIVFPANSSPRSAFELLLNRFPRVMWNRRNRNCKTPIIPVAIFQAVNVSPAFESSL
jgi:hypothetical protein